MPAIQNISNFQNISTGINLPPQINININNYNINNFNLNSQKIYKNHQSFNLIKPQNNSNLQGLFSPPNQIIFQNHSNIDNEQNINEQN